METGILLCLRTTGELVMILGNLEPGRGDAKVVEVRRPTMGKDGITHLVDTFYEFELETPEEHLRREAKDMILKADIQNEVLEAREAQEASKKTDISVN